MVERLVQRPNGAQDGNVICRFAGGIRGADDSVCGRDCGCRRERTMLWHSEREGVSERERERETLGEHERTCVRVCSTRCARTHALSTPQIVSGISSMCCERGDMI